MKRSTRLRRLETQRAPKSRGKRWFVTEDDETFRHREQTYTRARRQDCKSFCRIYN